MTSVFMREEHRRSSFAVPATSRSAPTEHVHILLCAHDPPGRIIECDRIAESAGQCRLHVIGLIRVVSADRQRLACAGRDRAPALAIPQGADPDNPGRLESKVGSTPLGEV